MPGNALARDLDLPFSASGNRASGLGAWEPKELRRRYSIHNRNFRKMYMHRYGNGGGLCAELVGLFKSTVRCLVSGVGLQVCLPPSRRGVVTKSGLSDFFEKFFDEKPHKFLHLIHPNAPGIRRLDQFVPSIALFL